MSRPRKYGTVEEMQAVIDRYFALCEDTKEPLTITGLALALDFTSRQALINCEGYTDINGNKFVDTIKRAKLKIEQAYELRNIARGNGGDIFALKQFDWTDKQTFAIDDKINNTLDDIRNQIMRDEE